MARLKKEIDTKREATEKVRHGPIDRVLQGPARYSGEAEPQLVDQECLRCKGLRAREGGAECFQR